MYNKHPKLQYFVLPPAARRTALEQCLDAARSSYLAQVQQVQQVQDSIGKRSRSLLDNCKYTSRLGDVAARSIL